MEKRFSEWDKVYVLIFKKDELFEKREEIVKEIGEDGYNMLVEFVRRWEKKMEEDERFGNILRFVIEINMDGTVNWDGSIAEVLYFPTVAPPITLPEMGASMAGYPIDPVRSLFEPFFEPPEPVIVYINRFLREGKGIVLP
jgi:hypothetical protein